MFNIQIAKKDLAEALAYVESTVGNNSQNLGDDCVSLTDLGNNILEIYTTNGIEFSKVNIVLTNGTSGSVEKMPYVNFKRFKTMIDSIPDSEYVSIKSNVKDIEINYGTRKKALKLTGSTNGMIQLPTAINGAILTINKSVIEKGLAGACSIIKDDGNSSLTNCIRIFTNAFDVEITAVDIKNNRMFVHKGNTTESNSGEVLVEANKLKKAFKLFTGFNDLELECGTSVVRIAGADATNSSQMIVEAEYYARTLAGNYPKNVSAMFNNVPEYCVMNKDELKASLTRINAIEDNIIGSGTMELSINKNLVNIVKRSQYGTVEDSFNAENEIGYKIKDTFKAKPLAEVLKNFTDNGTYGSPNTFEMGQSNNNGNSANYYILKETGNTGSMFLVTGATVSSNNP